MFVFAFENVIKECTHVIEYVKFVNLKIKYVQKNLESVSIDA